MSACNRLDLQKLGSQLIMPKNLPDHWMVSSIALAWEVFGHIESVKILVILNPTGEILISSGFAFII